MAHNAENLSLAELRDFLLQKFTAGTFRHLFLYTADPGLRPIRHEFAPADGLTALVAKALEYAQEHDLLDALRREAERYDPSPHAAATPIPYQPPRPLPEFVGRKDELRRLTRALNPGVKTAITGLVGMGGLGKTELAKRAAQKVRKRFPDGVLWADCGEQDLVTIADLWAAGYKIQLPGDDEQAKTAAWRSLISAK